MKDNIRRLCEDRRGAVTIMTAIAAVAIMGFAAIVIDVGNLVYAKRALQAATDAAALAGAQDINKGTGGTALSTARRYSATAGNLNAAQNLNATMASGYPALRCFTSTGIPCPAPDNANGVVVKQNATVPALFAKALGLQNFQISASAAAGECRRRGKAIDAVIILDTTQSMNSNDPNCTQSGSTRLTCAFTGFRNLLSGFEPSLDHVALMIFPGLKDTTTTSGSGKKKKTTTTTAAQNAALEYDCSSSTPTSSAIAAYSELPLYLMVPLSSDYRNADGTLNTGSNLVKAARGGASGCTAGVTAYGGVGTYYADAVAAAKSYLSRERALRCREMDHFPRRRRCRREQRRYAQRQAKQSVPPGHHRGAGREDGGHDRHHDRLRRVDLGFEQLLHRLALDLGLRNAAANGFQFRKILFDQYRLRQRLHLGRQFDHQPERNLPIYREKSWYRRASAFRQYALRQAQSLRRMR